MNKNELIPSARRLIHWLRDMGYEFASAVADGRARELARRADVRMTMKYTHIGLQDQADALAGLPNPN